MQTLSNGFKKPQSGDRGAVVFTALEENIQALNDHTHDGSNSEPIASSALTKGTLAVSATTWVSDSASGMYRKSITFPGAHTHGDAFIRAFFNGGTYDGEECFPTIEKITSTTAYIYSPTNSQAFALVFV